MKNTLVWLHGFGYDKNDNLDFAKKLATALNADVLTLNAPNPSERDRGGYAWWPMARGDMHSTFDSRYEHSISLILNAVAGIPEQNLILAGRSQGGCAAINLALRGIIKPTAVIAFHSFYLPELLTKGINNYETPIIWVESANDTDLPNEMKESYKALTATGVSLHWILSTSSTDHNTIGAATIPEIKNYIL